MFVSVIIPVYNMKKYLPECLDSILGQTLPNVEILCIDDGSTDGSSEVLERYAEKYRSIKIFSNEHKGPGAARNLGIKKSEGEFVCMMDADDMYPDNDVLKDLFETAKKNNALICGGNILDMYPDERGLVANDWGRAESGEFLYSTINPRIYGQTRFIYKKEFLIERKILYPENIIRFEDPPFLLKALLEAEKYYMTPRNVYIRRVSYKNIHVTRDIGVGIWKGILMCIRIMAEHDLRDFYTKEIVPMYDSHAEYYFPYAMKDDGELDDILHQIDDVVFSWIGKHSPKTGNNDVKKLTDIFRTELDFCMNAPELIVYGAGKVAEKLIGKGILDPERICAFAETECTGNRKIHEIEKISITEALFRYPQARIVIAGNDRNSHEMEKTVNMADKKDYVVLNTTKIRQMEILGIA